MTEERRSRVLTDQDLAALVEAISCTRPVPDNLHLEHHQFIGEWIGRARRRAETMETIRAQVGGWGIIVALSGIGYAVWEWVRSHLR